MNPAVVREGPLPERAGVRVRVEIWTPAWGGMAVHVEYTGKPPALVEAGLVDAYMVSRITKLRRGGPPSDQNRWRFSLRLAVETSKYCSALRAWESGSDVTLQRRPRNEEEAYAQPGVRWLFPNGFQHEIDFQRQGDAKVSTHDSLTQQIIDHWHELEPEQQRLFNRFAQLVVAVRGDELAQRDLQRHKYLSLEATVDMLERRAALRQPTH